MKLGTLISVSGAIDFPQESRFHNLARIEQPKSASPPASTAARFSPAPARSTWRSDRFTRICLWFVVALLCLAAVA